MILTELMDCFEQEKVDNAKFPNLTREVKYYKENTKGVNKMCQIVEEYAQEQADFQKALDVVDHIEKIMAKQNKPVEYACVLLDISIKTYEDAKKLLSEKSVIA